MADGSARNTYDPSVVSSPSSFCVWLVRPVALALFSLGLVVFIAGITSLSTHGTDSGSRILLTPVGSVILSLGVLLVIGVTMKQREEKKMTQRSENDVLDLTATEMSVGNDCSTEFPGDDDGQNPQQSTFSRFPPSPRCQEDVDPARSIFSLPAVTPMMDHNEVLVVLEDPSLFEIPPSYEEACALSSEVDV